MKKAKSSMESKIKDLENKVSNLESEKLDIKC